MADADHNLNDNYHQSAIKAPPPPARTTPNINPNYYSNSDYFHHSSSSSNAATPNASYRPPSSSSSSTSSTLLRTRRQPPLTMRLPPPAPTLAPTTTSAKAYANSLSAQQQLQLHQKEIISSATRASGIPAHLLSTGPSSPKLIPMGSPSGVVTPLMLEQERLSDYFAVSQR